MVWDALAVKLASDETKTTTAKLAFCLLLLCSFGLRCSSFSVCSAILLFFRFRKRLSRIIWRKESLSFFLSTGLAACCWLAAGC